MKTILKTLLIHPSMDGYISYRKFKNVFHGRDPIFDDIFRFMDDYYKEYTYFIDWEYLIKELTLEGQFKHVDYCTSLQAPEIPVLPDPKSFIHHLNALQQIQTQTDLVRATQKFMGDLATGSKDLDVVETKVNEQIAHLHKIKMGLQTGSKSNSSLLYGPEADSKAIEAYTKIKEKNLSGEASYFKLPFKELDDLQFKPGDLCIIGGFTSQGKSVLARAMAYHFLVEYGLNCVYFSFEMSHDATLQLFYCLHANNKKIFPGVTPISYKKYKDGMLNAEEEDFLFRYAIPDFNNGEYYGSLYVEQPDKVNYTLVDLELKIAEIENTVMPVHQCWVDYLTLMFPLNSGKGKPERGDYNQMIKSFKNIGLTHKNGNGISAPMLMGTPAQISRHEYNDCLKNDGLYSPSCLRDYSELESSGDIILTSLLTTEMRPEKKIRFQNLKNRDGKLVVDPVDCSIDFENGFTLIDPYSRNLMEQSKVLLTLKI